MARKVLAIKLRSMGDTVLFTAPLAELSSFYPQAEIHVLVNSEWAPLLKGQPGIHHLWTYDQPKSKFEKAFSATLLGLKLRHENFDTVINFHASSTSAWIARLSGAGSRSIHFHGHQDSNRFSTVQIPGKGILKPIIERDMDAIRALGAHIPAGRSPKIFLQPSEIQAAEKTLADLNLKAPILGLSLGASRPSKCWPIERFATLAVEWCSRQEGSVLAFAGPQEESIIQDFLKTVSEFLESTVENQKTRADIRSKIVATHEFSLRTLATILSRISVLAGNDSGPKHLAISVGTPTVTLFGPEHPFEWHPYPKNRNPYFFIEPLPCRKDADLEMPAWCGIKECLTEEHKCMRLIGTDSVLAECLRVSRGL